MNLTDEKCPAAYSIPASLNDAPPGVVQVSSRHALDVLSSIITGTSLICASIALSIATSSCSWTVPIPSLVPHQEFPSIIVWGTDRLRGTSGQWVASSLSDVQVAIPEVCYTPGSAAIKVVL